MSIKELDEVLFIQHLPKKWQEKVKELQAQGVPDKTIAKMIAQTQTAKKGETRAELMAAAGVRPARTPDAERRQETTEAAMSLDNNPFLEGKEARDLGVPLMQERTRKMMLAAKAADAEAGAESTDDEARS